KKVVVPSASLVEKAESQILVVLGILLSATAVVPLIHSRRSSCDWCVSRGSSRGSWGTVSDAARDRGDEVLDVDSLECHCEEPGPERLDGDVGRPQDSRDLVSGDGKIISVEDECSIDASLLFDRRHLLL
ncbi:hypothetical protein PMAYCL1PPCAC_27520, partial [Pristionchus mayeri]